MITITRRGKPVARLSPLHPELTADAVLERFRGLAPIDYESFRADVDQFIDWELLLVRCQPVISVGSSIPRW